MSESELVTAKIAELRPKATERAAAKPRRVAAAKRRRRRSVKSTATSTAAGLLSTASGSVVSLAALMSALALASVSGFFGIVGMTAIFAAAVMPVMVMTGVLEAAKLVTAAWLARHWRTAPLVLRLPLVVMVLLLMALTAIGTFGFLSHAHLDRQIVAAEAIARDAAPLQQRIALAQSAVADLDGRIVQLDDMVKASTMRGRTKLAMALVNDQSKSRSDLVTQRQDVAERLSSLRVEQAGVEAQRVRLAGEAGPALYLTKLFGSDDTEATIRFITALLVLVLDPLAVLLTVAASYQRSSSSPPQRRAS